MLPNIFTISLFIQFYNLIVGWPKSDKCIQLIVMWKVDLTNVQDSYLSIVPDRLHNDQFETSDALIIWKGCFQGEVNDRHLHYWLGEHVTQELAGLTASLAMEMSLEKCDGSSLIQREFYGEESEDFRSYFETMAWPYHDIDRSDKKLYYLRGDQPRIKQVPIDMNMLEKPGCLVLQTKNACFIHHGKTVNANDTKMASELATKLELARNHQNSIHTVVAGGRTTDSRSSREFLSELSINRSMYSILTNSVSNDSQEQEDFESTRDKEMSLVIVYQAYNRRKKLSMRVENIKLGRPMKMDILHTEFCIILDSASEGGIFLWIGKKTNKAERSRAARVAEEMIYKKNYPLQTLVTVVEEGAEPLEFRINFVDGLE